MELIKHLGSCVPLFLVAVVFDVVGLILLFIGIFANLRINGRFYGDFLIYTGSLVVFISLGCWLMWYVWNVQVFEDDGPKKRDSMVDLLARKLSQRMSQRQKAGGRVVKRAGDEDSGQEAPAPHKASRVTWGKSSAYHNQGYDGSPEYPSEEKDKEENWEI